jgi:hypothetical protein
VQNSEFHHSHLAPEENIYSELEFPPSRIRRSCELLDQEEDDLSESEDEEASLTASSSDSEAEKEERVGGRPWFDRPACREDNHDPAVPNVRKQSEGQCHVVPKAGQHGAEERSGRKSTQKLDFHHTTNQSGQLLNIVRSKNHQHSESNHATVAAATTNKQNGGDLYHQVRKAAPPHPNSGQQHHLMARTSTSMASSSWLRSNCSSSSSTNTSVQDEEEEEEEEGSSSKTGTSLVSSPDSGYKSRQSNAGDTSYLSSDSSSEEELCKIHVAGRG